jgi:hypothetical protein
MTFFALVFLYATLATATYYLVARAKVTSWIWRRYPRPIAYWADCAACAGTWYALGWAWVAYHYNGTDLMLATPIWLHFVLAGAIGMVWTPVLAWLQAYTYTALLPEDEGDAVEG